MAIDVEVFSGVEGTSREYTGTLKDENGVVPILATLAITVQNKATGATVNNRSAQPCLGANNVTYNTGTGVVTWMAQSADLPGGGVILKVRFDYTYGTPTLGGTWEFEVRVDPRDHSYSTMPLCTKSDVLRQPGLAALRASLVNDRDTEEWIWKRIESLSRTAERDRWFLTKQYTETVDAHYGQRVVQVRAYPIVSVTSIKQAFDGNFSGAFTYASNDYGLLREGRTGQIKLRYGAFLEWPQSIQVVYTGGIATSVDTVPADLRDAVAQQVAFEVRRGAEPHVNGEMQQGGSITYAPLGIQPYVAEVFGRYQQSL